MVDLTRPWPFGLGTPLWWRPVVAALAVLGVALFADRALSLYAQGWPGPVRGALEQITPFGESGWILVPSAALCAVMALLAVFVPWKLMRLMLWQFAALFGFIFAGVGLPSAFTTLVKRLIGRWRPNAEGQTLVFQPNWLDWTHQSFPSGHATTAFALFAVIGLVAPRWFYPGLVLATAIAVSRLSMGVHFPSDVVAGAIVGILGAYLVRWLFARQGWMFRRTRDGRIVSRALSSLTRYVSLKRRESVRAPRASRP
jgi:undecaprenyl-diphosphatase